MDSKTEDIEIRPPGTSQPRAGKRSYSLVASATPTKSLFRRVRYSIGVVYEIHHHKTGKYARIFVGNGDRMSIKVQDSASYGPGDLLQITDTKVEGISRPCIYGPHTQPVSENCHPLCEGTVKYFDRARKVWNVKVKTIKHFLKVRKGSTTSPLLRDQTVFFIPTFQNGFMEVKKIMAVQGGIPANTLPTWTISDELMSRLAQHFPDISLVDPTTRANDGMVDLLDLALAERDLPRSSGTIYQAPYLHLEELMIRQQSPPNTAWADDKQFHEKLAEGLSPLLYIADDDPAKIWKLRRDLRKIQEAGVVRRVRVLYPAPQMVTASSTFPPDPDT